MSRHKLRPAIAYELRRDTQFNTLYFNDGRVTFTPSMATRAGTVFAAAPIVQGKFDITGVSDVLSFVRGDAVSGNWYDNTDPYQGTIILWVTPEFEGDDGLDHLFVYDNSNRLQVRKNAADQLQFLRDGQNVYADVSAWDAGTTYCLACRWDSKSPIDGTNYMCISIDDVHTFGAVTAPATNEPGNLHFIGSTGVSAPANAELEGLTIYRRVLHDGLYGCDVGNGDEIALIYDGGV